MDIRIIDYQKVKRVIMKINFIWFNYFRPTWYFDNINDINLNSIQKKGIKYIFCDLDNTLVPHFSHYPNKNCSLFFQKLHELDFKVFIISNNNKKRVENFCNLLKVDDFVYNAKKPFVKKIKKIIKKHNIKIEDSIFIGDQFITDILVANRLGAKSILVLPLIELSKTSIKNIIIFLIENLIYKNLTKNNDLNVNDSLLLVDYDFI